jgi:hypothetical protein
MGAGPTVKEFLLWDYVDDISICDRLIEFYKNSDEKKLGIIGDGFKPEIKDSTDVSLKVNNDLGQEYLTQLQIIVKKYINKFPFVDSYGPWTVLEGLSIQHYAPPDQAFKAWHTERAGGSFTDIIRHLVFMTYLNDVHDGGETEWYHQEVKLSPRKGLTAIWPVDWTYTHRGVPSKTEHKYIVTGWFSYYSKGQTQG